MITLTLAHARKLRRYYNPKDQQLNERITSLNLTLNKYLEIKHLDDLLNTILLEYRISSKAFHNIRIRTPKITKARHIFYILALQVKGGESIANIGHYMNVNPATISKRTSVALKHTKELEVEIKLIKDKYELL